MTGEYRVLLRRVTRRSGAYFFAIVWAVLSALDGAAATLTVTSVADSGAGSLRQAILDANATIGLDTISFQIPGSGVHTISVSAALPAITQPLVIDGTSQPGYANTPVIELNGGSISIPNVDGLRLAAGNSTIRGLAINRFGGAGIHVQLPGGTNFIQGNFIGTDTTGTLNQGNGVSPQHSGGVWIEGSSGNWIGGTAPADRNLISGNGGTGVYLQNCSGNKVQGNLIGTSVSGAAALGNTSSGIELSYAAGNLIGGTSAAARNVISGNGGSGVYLSSLGTTGNLVQGNYIGTDANGSLAISNAGDGVTVNGAAGNTIGGTSPGAGNLLSGNSQGGVGLKGANTDNNLVQGNFIGTDVSGGLALGNTLSGITIVGGDSNLVGGTTSAARNIVSANKQSGVYITTNSIGNLIQGNYIGVDATGATVLGNAVNGISIDSASFNTVGGTTDGARNIISGNTNYGIEVFNAAATSNLIQGNYVGPNVTGQAALGNKFSGIHIQSPGNTIGGTQGGAGNLISGNSQDGIFLDGSNAANNIIQGNFIGTAASGNSALGNVRAGIGISAAPANTIGGTAAGAGNVISGNGIPGTQGGIYLVGSGATGNVIQGNRIGTDPVGTLALGNRYEGVYLERASSNTIGGVVAGAGNLISANQTRGIFLVNAPGNVIQGNLIGTKQDGFSALGNLFHAVECEAGANNNTIGGAGAAGNRIAFAQTAGINSYAGVRIRNGSANNAILGNAIFSNNALGIDLGTVGVTDNDACDADTGANLQQNFPLLAQAVTGNGTGIRGTLNSKAGSAFLLQFFANPVCDSSGNGEGQIYLGQQSVVTSTGCDTSFVASLPGSVPVGYAITATATDSANNTSEFSACVPVSLVPDLKVAPAPNHEVSIAWTNTATGFVLKQTDSLSPVIQWTTVTNSPVVVNGQFVVTLSAAAGNRFYLLSFE